MDGKQLKNSILQWAIQGKLVPQDPNDEPASTLLEKIRAEKALLVSNGKLKKDKYESVIYKGDDNKYYEQIGKTVTCIDEDIPYELPNGWCWCRLNDLAFYRKGPFGSSLTKSMFVPKSKNSIKVYEQKNAIQKDYTLGEYYISQEKFDTMQSFVVNPNDIIVSCAGTIGETYLLPSNAPIGIINQALMRVCLYYMDIAPFWQMYFAYILLSETQMKGAGSAIKNIPPFEYLKRVLVTLPPLAEQKRIVARIEELMPLMERYAQAQASLDKLNGDIKDKLKKSILQWAIQGKLVPQDPNDEPASTLLHRINPQIRPITEDTPFDIPESWEWTTLKNICVFLSRGKSPTYSKEKKYPVFAQKCNLKDGWISLKEARFLDPTTIGKWKDEYKLRTGDVLINSTGTGTVCRTRLFDEKCLDGYPFVVPDSHVSVVRTYDEINCQYITYYISASNTQQFLEDNLAGSTNQKELYIGVLKNLFIPIPPLAEQKRIVARIEELFAIVETINS